MICHAVRSSGYLGSFLLAQLLSKWFALHLVILVFLHTNLNMYSLPGGFLTRLQQTEREKKTTPGNGCSLKVRLEPKLKTEG